MNIKDLQKKIIEFRDKRDWKQFHKPKDLSISLVLEAVELLEHFQWKNEEDVEKYLKSPKFKALKEEVADVAYYLFLIAHELNIDLEKEFLAKLRKNERKYPIRKAKSTAKKYSEL